VSSSLSVDLNRRRLHQISVADEFSASGPFSIELANRGEAVHVHLHLDDELSRVARLEAGNHYVEGDATRPVRVEVDPIDEPVSGKLKIVTAYGSEQQYVTVTVEPPVEKTEPVDVDETLARPPSRGEPEPALSDRVAPLLEDGTLPLIGFGTVAVIGALAVGLLVDSAVVLLGVGVVIGVAVAALVFAIR
jgi:hypothetical protein